MTKKKFYFILSISILVVTFFCVLMLQIQLNSFSEKQASAALNNTVTKQSDALSSMINGYFVGIESLAKRVSASGSIDSEDLKMGLEQIYGSDSNSFGFFALTDGKVYAEGGLSFDAQEEAFFTTALSGENVLCKSDFFGNENGGEIVFTTPIRYEDQIFGIIGVALSQNYIMDRMQTDLYEQTAVSFLCDENHNMMVNDQDNSRLSTELLQHLVNDFQKTSEFPLKHTINKQKYYLVVQPLNIPQNWTVITVVPSEAVFRSLVDDFSYVYILVSFLYLSFLFLICFIIIENRKMFLELRKEKNIAIKERDSFLQQNSEIILSLGSIYYSIYRIDIENMTATPLRNTINYPPQAQIPRYQIGKALPAEVIFHYIANNLADPSDQDNYSQFYCKENILKLYQSGINSQEITYRMKVAPDVYHWVRSIIYFPQDTKSKNIAIIANCDIDRQYMQKLKEEKELADAYNAAKQANRAKSVFISNMSHDIRTPMNAITGMTAIASANINNKARVADCLKKINISSKHLLALINEVLDMSRIESGKVLLIEEELFLSDLIESISAIVLPKSNQKNQLLQIESQDIVHEKLICDEIRLHDILINLLANAINYTPEGGKIKLTIHEREINNDGTSIYDFIVADNGIGMDEELCAHIFEPFVRADNTKTSIQGSGLGLTIVQNLVSLLGGTIKVESTISKGSTFTVSLPLKTLNSTYEHLDELTGLRFLVVDDSPEDCDSVEQLLLNMGLSCEKVSSGEEAMQKLAENADYFAVILDYKMPHMNGIQTARGIRYDLRLTLPIILCSAYDCSDVEEEASIIGIEYIIYKPLFATKMARIISQIQGFTDTSNKQNAFNDSEKEFFSKKHVLLVEDNDINMEIAEEMLQLNGIKPEKAENGKQAVDIVISKSEDYYDLIFMDIQMPVMNGYEACKAIREYAGAKPKIIALTANAYASDIMTSLDSGMNDHLAKPIEMSQLQLVLKKWL